MFRLDVTHHPKVEELVRVGTWYLQELRRSEGKPLKLVISGSAGIAKTHIARKIYKFAQNYGADIILRRRLSHWSCFWVDWVALSEADDEQDFLDKLYEIESASMVVIDDVGSEADRFKNGVPNSRLRRILEAVRSKWVIITTNADRATIAEQYDTRVTDRLDAYNWVELGNVPSYRPKLKAQ